MDFIEDAFDAVGEAVGSVVDTVFSAADEYIAEPILSPIMNAIGDFLQPILMNGNLWFMALTAGFGAIAGGAAAAGEAGGEMSAADAEGWLGGGSGNTVNETVTGVSSDPSKTLLADSGQTVTDVGPGVGNVTQTGATPGATPGVGDAGAFDQFGARTGALGDTTIYDTAAGSGRGLIGSVMQWGKDNPLLAYGASQLVGGAMRGVGDNAMLDKQIQANRDMQTQRQQNAIELEEWKRRFQQSGSYFDALLPFRRTPNSGGLTRPDGTRVFSGGIINRAMGS